MTMAIVQIPTARRYSSSAGNYSQRFDFGTFEEGRNPLEVQGATNKLTLGFNISALLNGGA
jgi:hypothetical protein